MSADLQRRAAGLRRVRPRRRRREEPALPPNPYPTRAEDWITATIVQTRAPRAWAAEPDVAAWLEASRLNVARGIGDHLDDQGMATAIGRYAAHVDTGGEILERLAASLP